jgi:hypothetical protein
MDNIIDASQLFQEFKDVSEWKHFAESQYNTISNLIQENAQLKEEVKHLQELLTSISPGQSLPVPIVVSPEEALIDFQIQILKGNNMVPGKEMTLEEIKKLDLLLKNKNIIKQERAAMVVESKPISKGKLSMSQLAQIASQKGEEPA